MLEYSEKKEKKVHFFKIIFIWINFVWEMQWQESPLGYSEIILENKII